MLKKKKKKKRGHGSNCNVKFQYLVSIKIILCETEAASSQGKCCLTQNVFRNRIPLLQ